MKNDSRLNTRWFPLSQPESTAEWRLFCFPYAGGGAMLYRTWDARFPESVQVCPVQLPGRENRLSEPPVRAMSTLMEQLSEAILPWLDRRVAFFGYSMGAMIAYELARTLRTRGAKEPERMFLAAHGAPRYSLPVTHNRDLDDDAFLQRLRDLGGTPPEVLNNQELMAVMLPRLRADFSLYETWVVSRADPLTSPFVVMGGREDREVPEESLHAWREFTTATCEVVMLPGNHFFLHSATDSICSVVFRHLQSA